MARLNETQLIVKISKLQKDNEDDDVLLNNDTVEQLETIIAELVGAGVVVEASILDQLNE